VVKDNKDKICKKFFEFISALSTDLSYCPNTEIIITTPHSVTEEMDSLRKKNSEFDEIQYLEYRENYSEEIDDMADELPFDCQFIDVVPPH
jgi:formylmethanofuran dehydrogenase subunit E